MEKTLVILAAGMASRFGSLKQVQEIGPNGEFLIDYSIYDAIRAGFNKVVFVIRKENEKLFSESIGKRIANHIKVEYAYQEFDENIPEGRVKPLGTGHALLCVKDYVNGPFALISADDYYGHNSYKVISEYLDENKRLGIVGFSIGETIPEGEEVKRGVILEKDGVIDSMVECKVSKDTEKVTCIPLDETKETFTTSLDGKASMLMYGFGNDIFPMLEKDYQDFLENKDLLKDEFILTDTVDKCIQNGEADVLSTPDKWIGMTYQDDMKDVISQINDYIDKGIYKANLWED